MLLRYADSVRGKIKTDMPSGCERKEWNVSLVDVSGVALQKVGLEARALGMKLELLQGVAVEYPWLADQFDVIVLFSYLD